MPSKGAPLTHFSHKYCINIYIDWRNLHASLFCFYTSVGTFFERLCTSQNLSGQYLNGCYHGHGVLKYANSDVNDGDFYMVRSQFSFVLFCWIFSWV